MQTPQLLGIHHVTAIAGDPGTNAVKAVLPPLDLTPAHASRDG